MLQEIGLRAALVAMLSTMPVLATSAETGSSSPLQDAIAAANEEFAAGVQPRDSGAFKKLLAMLPGDVNGGYIVEGDISYTEAEVVDWVQSFAQGIPAAPESNEAKFNLVNGEIDYYPPDKRKLTYAIDVSSFADASQLEQVVSLMATATAQWETACAGCEIDFIDVTAGGDTATPPNFVVELRDAGGAFIARAFFPHYDQDRRFLTLDPSFFTSAFEPTGVLMHELGHVIGLRHEHIEGIPGCRLEGTSWVAVTEYDPKSVMHYFCGGGGSHAMTISELDAAGVTAVYTD